MDENFTFITREDLKTLGISNELSKVILNGISEQNNKAENLLILCDNLTSLMDQVMTYVTNKSGKMSFSYSYQQIRTKTFNKIMLVSAAVVFKVREFLLQEQLIFSLGVTDAEGNLYERQITSDQLFSTQGAMRGSGSRRAVVLSTALEKYEIANKQWQQEFNSSLNLAVAPGVWQQIQNLAYRGAFATSKRNNDFIEQNEKTFYRHYDPDINVYIQYSGQKGKRNRFYYDLGGGNLSFFNNGWLYEWLITFLKTAPQEDIDKFLQMMDNQASSSTPLEIFMKKMDSIPGYKGGDYQDDRFQYQAKFANPQVISYHSINLALSEIRTILKTWLIGQAEVEDATEAFLNLLTESDTQLINKSYTDIVEQQLLKLLVT